jgi:hypothetical protein
LTFGLYQERQTCCMRGFGRMAFGIKGRLELGQYHSRFRQLGRATRILLWAGFSRSKFAKSSVAMQSRGVDAV